MNLGAEAATQSFSTVDGATIGFTDQGSGVPVVFVPGFCCTQRWWDRQRTALRQTHRVLTYDLRGLGASPPNPHGHRVARYACDLRELIEHLDLRGVVLVGWSLGYAVCLAYLQLAGQARVAGLVLVEGSPKLLNDRTWRLGVADLEEGASLATAFRVEFAEAVDRLLRDVARSDDPDCQRLIADARVADAASMSQLFWDHLNQDWRDVLDTIEVPTLVVAGTASKIGQSVEAARYTASAIPRAQLELFEGAGHALFREQPARFNAVLRGFIRDGESAGVSDSGGNASLDPVE